MNKEIVHAIQLESAYQWDMRNLNADFRARNRKRMAWFITMLRANCLICKQPLTE